MKKFISAVVVTSLLFAGVSVFAYFFPEPDWGALLQEKTAMVTAESFELYTEAPNDVAPYYGAKFEPRNGIYFGMVTEQSDIMDEPIPAYLTYMDMSYGVTDIYYPANSIIEDSNAIVTVGFTVHDINTVNFDVFRTCLDNLASYNKPMLIRFANEMNVSSIGNDPDVYKSKFKTAADMIHQYPNFAVVWSPNDLGALDRPFEYYYPGDEYVDWVGISSYMKRYFQGSLNTSDKDKRYFMINEYAWCTNAVKPIVQFMQKNNINKPLMISEGGVSYHNKYETDNTAWALPRLRNMYWNLIMEYPQIKLINYFNVYRQDEAEHYDITENPQMVSAINEAYNSGAYIREYGKGAKFAFAKADAGYTLSAENNIVPLYVSAYIPNQPDITVTYTIDGTWYHSSNAAPYKCGLDISSLSEGMHTLLIKSSTGKQRSYTFYKRGNAITFGEEQVPQVKAVEVYVDGGQIIFDQPPIIENGRTLVPLRAIFEKLGAQVIWDAEKYYVTAYTDKVEVAFGIGDNYYLLNNQQMPFDVPSRIENGRTLIPLRAVSEAFNCEVGWNPESYSVTINTGK